MKLEVRRLLPLLAAFAVGALGSLILGAGPRSIPSSSADPEPWALPNSQVLDTGKADDIWAERHPWGRPAVNAEEAAAQAASVSVPVGVVETRGRLQALFSLGGSLPEPVVEGGQTPDGGMVTSITSTVVTWRDAEGELKRLELFLEESAAAVPPGSPAQPGQDERERRQRSPPGGLAPPGHADPRRPPANSNSDG